MASLPPIVKTVFSILKIIERKLFRVRHYGKVGFIRIKREIGDLFGMNAECVYYNDWI